MPHGYGRLYNEDGSYYEGCFENGKAHGPGTEYIIERSTKVKLFVGNFSNDKFEGHGKLFLGTLVRYEGSFREGVYDGVGTLYDSSYKRKIYTGSFEAGQFHGQGTAFKYDKEDWWISSPKVYEGQWKAGRYHGTVVKYHDKVTLKNVIQFSGEWKEGFLYGPHNEYSTKGIKILSGTFNEQGRRIGQFVFYNDSKEVARLQNYEQPDRSAQYGELLRDKFVLKLRKKN